MIQTAEGGLTEVVNMLQRARELAVQGANDTYTTLDRAKIALELVHYRVQQKSIA
jgi:flagellin